MYAHVYVITIFTFSYCKTIICPPLEFVATKRWSHMLFVITPARHCRILPLPLPLPLSLPFLLLYLYLYFILFIIRFHSFLR